METMYDRLGDLLSETLEAGHVKFVKPKEKVTQVKEEKTSEETPGKGHAESSEPIHFESKKPSENGAHYKNEQKATGTIIKAMSPELERAYRLLGIPYSSSREEVKKAYKDKLMYFHPDKHAGNAILEKVATDKTRQVMESYELILKYLVK